MGKDHFAIFLPTNEYTPWIILGLQAGSPMLADDDTRGDVQRSRPIGARSISTSTSSAADLAPDVPGASIANLYQEFERGTFAMYITGPWNLGEFRSRLPPELQHAWATAPLPGPDGPASGVSTAGGSSLVLFRGSSTRPRRVVAGRVPVAARAAAPLLRDLTGDLPARRRGLARHR